MLFRKSTLESRTLLKKDAKKICKALVELGVTAKHVPHEDDDPKHFSIEVDTDDGVLVGHVAAFIGASDRILDSVRFKV